MNTNKKTARMAGFLYLIYIVISIFADVGVRSKLIVLGDAATTARNMMASALQFRIGFVVDLVGALLFLLTAWALYVLLKPVNKNIALLFLLLNLGGVAVWCFSDLFLIASQLLLSGADYLKVFQTGQLQALAMLSLDMYKYGSLGIAQIFFGAWLFPLGYLVFTSGYLPRLLGIVLMVECFAWLLYPLQFFLFPSDFITYFSSSRSRRSSSWSGMRGIFRAPAGIVSRPQEGILVGFRAVDFRYAGLYDIRTHTVKPRGGANRGWLKTRVTLTRIQTWLGVR